MLKKKITFKDFNGVEKTATYYFNFNKIELAEMEVEIDGGLGEYIKQIVNSHNGKEILATFKNIVSKAYGVKSEDGLRFEKSPEISKAFFESPAWDAMTTQFFFTDGGEKECAAFLEGLMPEDLREEVAKEASADGNSNGLALA